MELSNTKERIMALVLKLLNEKSINDIKVKEISDTLCISRGTFYLYFDSVYAVLQQLEDDFFTGFNNLHTDFIDYPLSDRYYKEPHPILTVGITYLSINRELILTLFGAHGDQLFQKKVKKLAYKYFIEKALRESYLTNSENGRYISAFLAGGHIDMTIEWLKHGQSMTPEELSIQVYRMMFGFYISKKDGSN